MSIVSTRIKHGLAHYYYQSKTDYYHWRLRLNRKLRQNALHHYKQARLKGRDPQIVLMWKQWFLSRCLIDIQWFAKIIDTYMRLDLRTAMQNIDQTSRIPALQKWATNNTMRLKMLANAIDHYANATEKQRLWDLTDHCDPTNVTAVRAQMDLMVLTSTGFKFFAPLQH